MATNRDLLKEAIADARAVKETAIANAKAALEEVFTPYLKEKLAAKINEIDEANETMEEIMYDETEVKNEMMKEDEDMPMEEEVSLEELLAELDSEGESDLVSLYKQELSKKGVDPKAFMEWMMKGINSHEDYSGMSVDEMIEADIEFNENESGEKVDLAFIKDILDTHVPMFKEESGLTEAKEAKEEAEEEMSIEDMSEEDLKSFIEDVIRDMVAAGELEAGEEIEGEEEGEEEDEEEIEDEEDEEIDLEELLSEDEDMPMEEGLMDIGAKIKQLAKKIVGLEGNEKKFLEVVANERNKKLAAKYKADYEKYKTAAAEGNEIAIKIIKGIFDHIGYNNDLAYIINPKTGEITKTKAYSVAGSGVQGVDEIAELNSQLEEAYSTIETLKSELQEINLLNAKLLYTNKIFRNKSLTESQKIKVLTSFDKATSKKEVELVYETLQESLKVSTTKAPIKESLGSASKVLGNASAKPIIEVDNQFARWQQLAGIKK